MHLKRVVVTGLGAITPIGNSIAEYWEALINGKSGAAPITYYNTEKHKTKFVGAHERQGVHVQPLRPRFVRDPTLECGGKRKRHAAFGGTHRVRRCFPCSFGSPPEIPSKGGVALTLATAVQGARRVRSPLVKPAGFITSFRMTSAFEIVPLLKTVHRSR